SHVSFTHSLHLLYLHSFPTRRSSDLQAQIREIYHEHNGVDGYRSMTVYLARKGFHYSPITIHKYMNQETGLYAIVRPKKPEYIRSEEHTSELQSRFDLVCRLLLQKKK